MPWGSLYEVYKEGEPKGKRFISTRLLHVEEKREIRELREIVQSIMHSREKENLSEI